MNKDFLDHLNFPSHIPKDSNEMEKEIFPRSAGIYIRNKTARSSQNMLELLCKADQLRDQSAACSVQISERKPLSEISESEVFMVL